VSYLSHLASKRDSPVIERRNRWDYRPKRF